MIGLLVALPEGMAYYFRHNSSSLAVVGLDLDMHPAVHTAGSSDTADTRLAVVVPAEAPADNTVQY